MGHGLRQLLGRLGNFHHHLPALFPEKLGHDGQAQQVLRAGCRSEHDAAPPARRLRAIPVGVAQFVRELMQANQAQGDLAEVQLVVFPLQAQKAGRRSDDIQKQLLGGVAAVTPPLQRSVAAVRVRRQAGQGKGLDVRFVCDWQAQQDGFRDVVDSGVGLEQPRDDLLFNHREQGCFAGVVVSGVGGLGRGLGSKTTCPPFWRHRSHHQPGHALQRCQHGQAAWLSKRE